MLSLLLDEQISPRIAEQVRQRHPEVPIHSLHEWREGALLGRDDATVLRTALEARLTLVTYDLKTISPLLVEWGVLGQEHSGVILVDGRSIPSHDFGALGRALVAHWNKYRGDEWLNRVDFLRPARR